ncbi:MAG: O-antigen ligase family protein, partial [Pseudomonadota bacterium]
FTLYGRARGAFKDPNVLGAFLSATVVMAAHLCFISRGLVRACYALAVALILIGLLLSFSRSAWLTAFAAAALYAYLVVLVEPTNRRRLWFLSLIVMGALTAIVLLVGALQISGVGSLLSERATFSQSHDAGPEGRFGGQLKALQLIFEYPLGIGALEFRPRYHHEEPHNVFLSMFLNAGWPGGLIFTALLLGTAVYAFRSVTRPSPWQDLFIVFYAGYIATLIGGLVVDSDHWRHLFIFMGLVWGFSLAPRRQALLPAGLPHSVRGPSA